MLHQCDGANTELAVVKVESFSNCLGLVVDGESTDVGIEHEFYHRNDSRS
jgi:hypothetical protein